MEDITLLLNAIEDGDQRAANQLWQLVYAELRTIATRKMVDEQAGLTLTATSLVHEAYLRLTGNEESSVTPQFQNRRHFFGAAAEAMCRILIENARRKQTAKRGGNVSHLDFSLDRLALPEVREDLEALNEALDRLAKTRPRMAELIKLRFFIGLTTEEAADLLDISVRTAGDWWAYSRAWLRLEMQSSE